MNDPLPVEPEPDQPLSPEDVQEQPLSSEDDALPVVARLVVEIRSDGTRTIARGALEERTSGQRVALEARGGTPQQLSAQLLKNLLASPLLAGVAFKHMISDRGRRLSERLKDRLLPGRRRPPAD